MKILRPVAEAEVIAEFLRNEFHHPEFHHDRARFEPLVVHADTASETENALRRALLFRRRGHMWRELPPDTQWSEVRLEPQDIPRLRVFPRAQWRRLADGSFQLQQIAERVRSQQFNGRTAEFILQLNLLSEYLREDGAVSSVLLIGVDAEQPLTVLEGNHRLTAALLASPEFLLTRFRFLCGLSPRMTESCWYETSFRNLWRYAKNRLKHFYDRDADVERLLPALNGAGEHHAPAVGHVAPEAKQQHG